MFMYTHSSSDTSSIYLFAFNCLEKTKNEEKEAGIDPFLKRQAQPTTTFFRPI